MLLKTTFFIVAVTCVNAIGDLWPPCYGPSDACCDSCSTIPNGAWSKWIDYTSCSKTCGLFGRKVQRRTCDSWSFGCPCNGVYSRVVPCAPTPCTKAPVCAAGYTKYKSTATNAYLCGNVTSTTDYVPLNCFPCPAEGVWSAWSNVGACTATCGLFGKVNQTRTCESASYGCACTGPTTQTYACPKKPCPTGAPCSGGQVVVKNLVTNATQCGLQLAPAQVLHPIDCSTTTTSTTNTPAACASGCNQNLNSFLRAGDDGDLSFNYTTDASGCLTAKFMWFAVYRPYNATANIMTYNDGGMPILKSKSNGVFRCVIGNEWQVAGQPFSEIHCNSHGY
ncbi:unnamed protein product, partial [Mesorhabditis belari]|uniref:Uncharacterized protein n=1 Tax=Mesorhabditis belari TaxID=2138241 RepID=A0AAF3EEG8_9BILA